jgi:hypothetical protein
MEAGPQAGCVAAFAIGAWTHRAGGSEKAFTLGLSKDTCVSDMHLTAFFGLMDGGAVLQLYLCTGYCTARKVGASPFLVWNSPPRQNSLRSYIMLHATA